MHARQNPHPRLRLAGHPADRPPRARSACVLRGPSLRRHRRLRCATTPDGRSRASSSRAATPASTRRPPTRRRRRCSSSACRCWASATACRPWRTSSAARSRAATSASSAMPRCAPAATPRCSKASPTSPRAEGHGMLNVWMSHGDKVTEMPPGFKLMASTDELPDRRHGRRGARASTRVQFHPEVTHTSRARPSSSASCSTSAAAGPTGSWRDYVAEAVEKIRAQVGDEEVILGLSGGVDSSVAAALIHRAIGDQLTCVFVDHGLLRLDEGDMVMDDVRRQAARQGAPRRCQRPVPRPAGRRHRPGSQAQDHRPRVRRGVQGRSREAQGRRRARPGREVAGAGHDLPRRDRVGRRQEQERPTPSRATTTSAACPRRWA